MKALTTFYHSLLHFFYPSFCLHCDRQVYGKEKWICQECFASIEWINATLSCKTCGKPRRDRISFQCRTCQNQPIYLAPFSSCFYPEGPTYALHEYLRVYECEGVAKLFASLMVLRWKELSWPYPEAIIPIPDTRLETYVLKKQPSFLIARALSQSFAVPFKPVMTTVERGTSFGYRPKAFSHGKCIDQKILAITDMARDSDSLRQSRDVLLSLFPQSIYTLALFDRRGG